MIREVLNLSGQLKNANRFPEQDFLGVSGHLSGKRVYRELAILMSTRSLILQETVLTLYL
jgi:hypothetical protein